MSLRNGKIYHLEKVVKKFNTIPFVTFFINGKKVQIFSALTYLTIKITCCNKISLTILLIIDTTTGRFCNASVVFTLYFFFTFYFSALTYLNIKITCCNKISLTIFVNFRHHHGKVLQQLVSCSLFFFFTFLV